MSLEDDIQEIKERNKRVEADKAWETSWTRAVWIAGFTYCTAGVWLVVIHDALPWLKALVPAVGFLLSTVSLPAIKRRWIRSNVTNAFDQKLTSLRGVQRRSNPESNSG